LIIIETGHLTSFALLLGGGANGQGGDGCGSNYDYTLSWISFGFIVGAIIFVFIGAALIEFKYRYRRVMVGRRLTQLKNSQSPAL